MKNVTKLFTILFGIIAISAVMIMSFTACQNEPEDDPEIPKELRGTTWLHRDGDSVSFTKDTATVKPQGGSEQTFTLKDIEVLDTINTTTMYFSDKKLSDYIVMRDHVITSVTLGGIAKANFEKDMSFLLPEGVRNTTWINNNGDIISFALKTVTIKSKNGVEKTYPVFLADSRHQSDITSDLSGELLIRIAFSEDYDNFINHNISSSYIEIIYWDPPKANSVNYYFTGYLNDFRYVDLRSFKRQS